MNTDKAYLFGLIIGGGIVSDDSLTIVLPYKQWGEVSQNPDRAGKIAQDILTKVQPIFRNEYKMDVFYKTTPNWRITTSRVSEELTNELKQYGLPRNGDVRDYADIEKLLQNMNSGTKRAVIAGLVDTIGSLATTHRRFSDAYQVISFEFKGKNFKLVAEIIKTLVELKCIPDQILWNHPNQHSGIDKYYKGWKKGFKIRVILDDYIANGSFVFSSKKESAKQNKEKQGGRDLTNVTLNKKISVEGAKTVHSDENSEWLPDNLRGYHFIHNQHLAVVLGCEMSDTSTLLEQLKNPEKLINPFTILTKGTSEEINAILKKDPLLSVKKRRYRNIKYSLLNLIGVYEKNGNALVFGNKDGTGYPVSYVLQGMAYVLGSTIKGKTRGKRVSGNFLELLKNNKNSGDIKILIPDILTPLVITNHKNSALVGPVNPEVYKKLIQKNGDWLLKIRPIEEKDLLWKP
jgi:hypothetical protein